MAALLFLTICSFCSGNNPGILICLAVTVMFLSEPRTSAGKCFHGRTRKKKKASEDQSQRNRRGSHLHACWNACISSLSLLHVRSLLVLSLLTLACSPLPYSFLSSRTERDWCYDCYQLLTTLITFYSFDLPVRFLWGLALVCLGSHYDLLLSLSGQRCPTRTLGCPSFRRWATCRPP